MEKLSKLITIFGYVDYAASTAVLIYGTYTGSWRYIAAGILGYVIAYLKPSERLKNLLGAKLIRKPPALARPAADASSFSPQSTPSIQSQFDFRPRVRYPTANYFFSYTGQGTRQRESVDDVRNLAVILNFPGTRLRLGIRAEKIVPR